MASPQIENGFTKIANEIMDALIRQQDLSGQELRVSLFILRKTWGFNKKEDYISLSQIGKAIQASKIRCSQIVNSLQLMKILTVKENINGKTKKYMFNKDYEQWNTVNKKLNRLCFTNKTVKQNINHKIQYKRKRICDLEKSPLSPEKKKPKGNGKDPRVKSLIDHFHSLCKEQLDQVPTIEGVKDGSAIKRTLTKNSEERIKNIFDWYIKSPKAQEHGLKISVALSDHSISEYDKKGRWLYEG